MRGLTEILAPAGSMDSLKAAVAAGADAVYAGGSRFGARAYADNFDETGLMDAIDYVHLHGRKLYLTVNTLLKEQELEGQLYDYLMPYYKQGLDAVIVQDIGVLHYIRKYFPELPIHASTQMTITGIDGARLLEAEGVERVVTARELHIDEIQKISRETGLEIESFVHGALCYCYSGQCLFSSFLGGRSGNRGQCAQPCRLKYRAEGQREEQYLLSLKDICTLESIPELIEAGIDSFKIEGRMKKPEYVAGVTAMYRKYTDLYYNLKEECPDGTKTAAFIKEKFRIEDRDREMLLDLYNRGGFHGGYYYTANGREMMALDRPNHAGVPAVRLEQRQGRKWCGTVLTDLNPQDVLELPVTKGQEKAGNYTCGFSALKGTKIQLSLSAACPLKPGMILNRTRNDRLIQSLRDQYVDRKIKEKINGKFTLSAGEIATLSISCGEVSVTVQGEMAQEALNQPMDAQRIRKQLQKTGNTAFEFEELEIGIEGKPFMPLQSINEMRREALEKLERAMVETFRRTMPQQISRKLSWTEEEKGPQGRIPELYATASTREQLSVLFDSQEVSRIYADCTVFPTIWENQDIVNLTAQAHRKGKEIYLCMPHIFREKTRKQFAQGWDLIENAGFDGMLVRNYESFQFLSQRGFAKSVITDYNLYQFNRWAKAFWKERGAAGFTAPLELNAAELRELGISAGELLVYGFVPMIVSAGCVKKTLGKCGKGVDIVGITDRYHKKFPVKANCDYCYNIMYNYAPVYLGDKLEEVYALNPAAMRLGFTVESRDETRQVLELFKKAAAGDVAEFTGRDFTRGHFKRGIK
ncbi:U32 family peptidase [Bariatricus massiliensis]|uniref:U32 family peptidase n=1 Tax=Bariatricus massiliensis TaxID=1745713 RepID=A0ABS8DBX1_9FIRM|nr:DUF3656 domain-containing protein [Bariatricus massiliensis]MCB7303817.1 U32 family peptidase [Bariatricus massiliensis]MCB7373233.1 U32 family peptidase [Bariatricus massiliensis]MCB7385903.1 U32 family peptidase [Bariatricus massiliensis]MCB7410065.1 U32 family peptidase [Bariatricus massiliensis]MCQ5252967.1 U32 family peptidase [Bariatricus massiliensis]